MTLSDPRTWGHAVRSRPRAAIGVALLVTIAVLALSAPERTALLSASRDLVAWIDRNPVWGAALFLAFATFGKLTPVPGGVPVMLTGGFLLGPWLGPPLAALGSGLSATMVTAVGRFLFPDTVDRLWGERLRRYEEALARDGFLYLLMIRMLPIVPAWISNLLPILVEVRLSTVFLATVIGVLPISFIVGRLGATLQDLTEAATVTPWSIFTAETIGLLLALTALSAVAVVLRRRSRVPE